MFINLSTTVVKISPHAIKGSAGSAPRYTVEVRFGIALRTNRELIGNWSIAAMWREGRDTGNLWASMRFILFSWKRTEKFCKSPTHVDRLIAEEKQQFIPKSPLEMSWTRKLASHLGDGNESPWLSCSHVMNNACEQTCFQCVDHARSKLRWLRLLYAHTSGRDLIAPMSRISRALKSNVNSWFTNLEVVRAWNVPSPVTKRHLGRCSSALWSDKCALGSNPIDIT